MSNFVSGRHFLQTPGPTNLPDRVMNAMHRNAINHRGPEFAHSVATSSPNCGPCSKRMAPRSGFSLPRAPAHGNLR